MAPRAFPLRSRVRTVSSLALGLTASVVGCAAPAAPQVAPSAASPRFKTSASAVADAKGGRQPEPPKPGADDAERLGDAARTHAERLAEAMGAASAPDLSADPMEDDNGEIQWLSPQTTRARAQARDARPATRPAAEAAAANDAGESATAVTPAAAPPTPRRATVADAPRDRKELMNRLLSLVRGGSDPALVKAMTAASLAVMEPGRDLDAADLDPLAPEQRDQVRRYHQAVKTLGAQLAAGKGRLDADALVADLERTFGEQPVSIRGVQLCKRVSGYGVYEPFETTTFLAGAEHPMIVYVELDHFRAVPAKGADGFQVRLTQELELFNESDGLAIWRQPAVEILDQSRNRRRDFFVVQLVKLPARLSVGKYVLKVRINDQNGGSVDESSVPVQVVADQSLATAAGPKR